MTPEQAQRLLDQTSAIPQLEANYDPGNETWEIGGERPIGDGYTVRASTAEVYGERFARLFAAAPELAQTVIDQAEKIERLDSYIDSLLDYVAPGVAENYARRILHPGDLGEEVTDDLHDAR